MCERQVAGTSREVSSRSFLRNKGVSPRLNIAAGQKQVRRKGTPWSIQKEMAVARLLLVITQLLE